MELKLFYMGPVSGMNAEQIRTAEEFINSQIYGSVAINSPVTGPRICNLNNITRQTINRLLYATDSTSQKVAIIQTNPKSEIIYSNGCSQLIVGGKISIVQDRQLKKETWNDEMLTYFPDGPEGESYCLLEFIPESARIMLK